MPIREYDFFHQLCFFSNYLIPQCDGTKQKKRIEFGRLETDSYLHSFRERYCLSRFVSENEFDTVKKLLRWTYESLLFLQYMEETVACSNSTEMIELAKREKISLNCYCHAYILRDALQSVGISARLVYCLPINCGFNGNHVVVEYYSDLEKRWILIDPTYNIWVTDEKENKLSLFELREHIVHQKPLEIVKNNRFDKICKMNVLSDSLKDNYLRTMIPILIVLQYESIEAYQILQYRLIPECYLIPDVSKKEDDVCYINDYTLLYAEGNEDKYGIQTVKI